MNTKVEKRHIVKNKKYLCELLIKQTYYFDKSRLYLMFWGVSTAFLSKKKFYLKLFSYFLCIFFDSFFDILYVAAILHQSYYDICF